MSTNLSVVHERGGLVSLSPMYDVVPTLAFVPGQARAAMPVAGRFRMGEIGVDHLVTEAVSWGIPERVARSTVLGTIIGLRDGIAVADQAVPEVDPRARDAVLGQLGRLEASAG